MKVILNEINGIADAIVALYISKRTWNKELDYEIRKTVEIATDRKGYFQNKLIDDVTRNKFEHWINLLLQWSKVHITLAKFIDLSFTVEGLHRGGQDDWDSHAKRFDNRIVRSSTRLSNYNEHEKSEYYKDKILTMNEAINLLNINVPNKFQDSGGITWVKSGNGYIREDLKENKDIKRGLYMLSIPSNFIFRVNLMEFSHIYKERNKNGSANPEVKECCEKCMSEINRFQPFITSDWMMATKN